MVTFYPEGNADRENEVQVSTAFEAKSPGSKVTLTFGGGYNLPPILQRYLAGNPPEISPTGSSLSLLFQGNAGTPGLKYAVAGQLYDLTPSLQGPLEGYDQAKWVDNIYPAVMQFITDPTTQKLYTVPRDVIYLQMWYNQDIFEKNGVTPPTTWTEFLDVAAKLKAAGVVPYTVANYNGYQGFWWDHFLLRNADPQAVWDAIHGKGDLAAIPGVKEAAQEYYKLIQGDYFIPGFEGTDFTAAQLKFFQGDAAMILMGSWLIGEMKASIPADFRIGSFRFPTFEGGGGNQLGIMGNVNTYVVAAQSKRQDLAVEWLRIMGSKANQNVRVKDLNYFSGYMGTDQPTGSEGVAELMQQPGALYYVNWGLEVQPLTLYDAFYNPVVEFMTKKLTPEEFVAKQAKNLQDYWAANPSQ